MREFDVAIVGAGLTGSIAATMLSRAGLSVAIVDPNRTYPDDFRVEKFDSEQIAVLRKTGLCDTVVAASTHDRSVWVSRLGRLAEKRASDQLGFDYGRLVNALRAEFPANVIAIHGKVTGIANSPDRQHVTLSTGEAIEARLVVMASGLGNGLRQSLGMEREDQSRCHSVTLGFDIEPAGGGSFPFRALTHYGEHPHFRVAYITLFPIGARMRANFFVYRELDDPWLRAFRAAPEATLKGVVPNLERLTGPFRVTGPVKVRPIDLYATTNYRQPGVVLVGDAFATACPAAGTGARKALVDVERLCNGHVNSWLATPGMGVEKIASFYDDPEKLNSDRRSHALAYSTRAMAIDPSYAYRVRRWALLSYTRMRWAARSAAAAAGQAARWAGAGLEGRTRPGRLDATAPARSPGPRS
jgi:2-polyprenyl-6-methoxyphenol hydroxylase-like FAD-dependent oxidoreductase